jgi:Zn-dependent M28 family amino/carboxypeptidase
VPCKNEARLSAVNALFEKMGAEPSQITVAKYANVENLIVGKPGATEEKIIVGAHYDKVSAGCGAVDNWSGIVVLAHLYRTFKQVPLNKTLIIVAFGKEEEGLLGSKAMVWGIKKEETSQYCAMINIDSLGMGIPQVADNMSTQKLEDLASGLAKKMNMPFRHASILGAGADSQPFVAKGIPALTLHGLTDDWRSVLHTTDDKPSRVDPASVYLGYGLVLALVASIDKGACGAYR